MEAMWVQAHQAAPCATSRYVRVLCLCGVCAHAMGLHLRTAKDLHNTIARHMWVTGSPPYPDA